MYFYNLIDLNIIESQFYFYRRNVMSSISVKQIINTSLVSASIAFALTYCRDADPVSQVIMWGVAVGVAAILISNTLGNNESRTPTGRLITGNNFTLFVPASENSRHDALQRLLQP